MKYRSIKIPPVTGNLSLKDAENAARNVASNGTHVRRDVVKSSTVKFAKSVAGSALTQSHSMSSGAARASRSLAGGQRGTTKSISARHKYQTTKKWLHTKTLSSSTFPLIGATNLCLRQLCLQSMTAASWHAALWRMTIHPGYV